MLHGFMESSNHIEHPQKILWITVMKIIGKQFIIQELKLTNMNKNRTINEQEENTFDLYSKMIQRIDDEIASSIQNGIINLYDLSDEIENDDELSDSQKKSLIKFVEAVTDTYI